MTLNKLPQIQKTLIKSILLTLTIGIIIGLFYVSQKASYEPKEISSYYQGNLVDDEFAIESGKTLNELLLTTHNHIISFTFIFAIIGFLISISSIKNKFKKVLIVEPFISIVVTFSMMFFIKYVHPNFVYLMIVSSLLMYITYFLSVYIILKDLKKE